jgi:ABC-type Na+ efflux pump permease subunit
MQELVSPAQAEAIVRVAALGLVGVGIAVGAVGALFVRPRRAAPVVGGLVAAAGALAYILWMVYNSLTARFGLDSVKALIINLGIFAVVGLAYGALAARVWSWATGSHEAGD